MSDKMKDLIGRLFNTKSDIDSNEQVVMLHKGEVIISAKNAKKFPSIPNLQNIMVSLK